MERERHKCLQIFSCVRHYGTSHAASQQTTSSSRLTHSKTQCNLTIVKLPRHAVNNVDWATRGSKPRGKLVTVSREAAIDQSVEELVHSHTEHLRH